jgi:hypothetical protein
VALSFNLSPGVSLGNAVQNMQLAETEIGEPAMLETTFQSTASEFQKSLSTQPLLIANCRLYRPWRPLQIASSIRSSHFAAAHLRGKKDQPSQKPPCGGSSAFFRS